VSTIKELNRGLIKHNFIASFFVYYEMRNFLVYKNAIIAIAFDISSLN
jgi:hypothetical protein